MNRFAVKREHLPEIRANAHRKGYSLGYRWGALFGYFIGFASALILIEWIL